MTFEEFFKKKKIDLVLLQNGEPALFMEFKNHYEQMGEKSFDHTKKYWFNQLRLKFPLAPEIKVEKVIIENQLAEQTIADTLTESATPSPSVGFKPRFKAGMASKPVEEKITEPTAPAEDKPTEAATPTPSVGFKPRFKASMVAKPAEEKAAELTVPAEDKPTEAAAPTPSVGFKPRFKVSMVGKPAEEKPAENTDPEVKEEPKEEKPAEETTPKPVGFKPRFNAAKMTKPKEPGEE